jgi:hypothetical protein
MKQQKFWILRRSNPWSVRDLKGNYVCDCPTQYNEEVIKKIVEAKSIKRILSICKKLEK